MYVQGLWNMLTLSLLAASLRASEEPVQVLLSNHSVASCSC